MRREDYRPLSIGLHPGKLTPPNEKYPFLHKQDISDREQRGLMNQKEQNAIERELDNVGASLNPEDIKRSNFLYNRLNELRQEQSSFDELQLRDNDPMEDEEPLEDLDDMSIEGDLPPLDVPPASARDPFTNEPLEIRKGKIVEPKPRPGSPRANPLQGLGRPLDPYEIEQFNFGAPDLRPPTHRGKEQRPYVPAFEP